MQFLRLISWPYLRKHAVRSLLTVVGIVLGRRCLRRDAYRQSGGVLCLRAHSRSHRRRRAAADHIRRSGISGRRSGARSSGAAKSRSRYQSSKHPPATNLPGQGNILILGVDMTGDRSLREYDLESGEEAVVDDPLGVPRTARFDHRDEGICRAKWAFRRQSAHVVDDGRGTRRSRCGASCGPVASPAPSAETWR